MPEVGPFILGGLGSIGYGGYSYSQVDQLNDNYSNSLLSSDASKYRNELESLNLTLNITVITGGISVLIGTILNSTLPDYNKVFDQLKQTEFDITFLESKLEN